jgi:hypothetical protein
LIIEKKIFFLLAKKQLVYEQETTKDEEEMDHVYVQLERSSIALHYSMGNTKNLLIFFFELEYCFF